MDSQFIFLEDGRRGLFMKYKQPIAVLLLLLIVVSATLVGYIAHKQNILDMDHFAHRAPVQGGTPWTAGHSVNPDVLTWKEKEEDDKTIYNNLIIEEENPIVVQVIATAPESIVKNDVHKVRGNRTVDGQYEVRRGDTLSGMSLNQWGNAMLWPDLYVNNAWIYSDPDLILPGEMVFLFKRLGGVSGILNTEEVKLISEAYIEVYELYAKLGDRRSSSRLYVLGMALRFEPNFFTIYADRIMTADIATVMQLRADRNKLD
jgi:hypothetical protein